MTDEQQDKEESSVFLRIATRYLMNGCDGCDFLETGKTCDARPINCKWMVLHRYFEGREDE